MSYRLISWGANSHGQLGQGIRSEECLFPCEVDLSNCSLKLENIRKIVGGGGHTIILDNDGRVYSCGWNNKGQAGFPFEENILTFHEIGGKLRDEVVTDIACGWDCSAALTIEGKLFLWGSNCYGQLGKNPNYLRWTHDPFHVKTDRKIKTVSIGLRHTALITEDRKVLIAGSGNKGQLGLSPSKDVDLLEATYSFTEVSTLRDIENISCGQYHTIALAKDGNLYAFGDNKHGQLGLNTNVFSKTSFPTTLPNVKFDYPVEIHCGWSHGIALSGGQMFSWGRNTYGQLGCSNFEKLFTWRIMQVENLTEIRQVSVGSQHNVALTEDGKVFCWGWNEHGSCGNGHTKDVPVPEQLPLPAKSVAIYIGSGAGCSFALIKIS